MTFQSEILISDGVQQVTLSGRLDSATSNTFEKSLPSLFETNGSRTFIDFSGLGYVSSPGLRVVLMAAKRAKLSQGRLVLCGMLPHVREVFEISGFLRILEVVEDRAAAMSLLSA